MTEFCQMCFSTLGELKYLKICISLVRLCDAFVFCGGGGGDIGRDRDHGAKLEVGG